MLRWRIIFTRGEELKYLSHLDLMRLWERAFRRAGVPLAYSQGFSPHPRLSLAAPLPVGVTGLGELMEVFLKRPLPRHRLAPALAHSLPRGIEVLGLDPAPPQAPSLPSQVRWATYQVEVEDSPERGAVEAAIGSFLQARSLPWQHQRDQEVRRYDLRALVQELSVEAAGPPLTLGMKLICSPQGSGRAEQVALALGLKPGNICRLALGLEAP